jgi:hypothetical protein
MEKLNLPAYQFEVIMEDQNKYIFDNLRKKYVLLTPEEWVRQNFLQFLIHEKHYSPELIKVETAIMLNKLKKRCDIVVYNRKAQPAVIVECKAAKVNITQDVFEQIARYNLTLKVDYLIVTNGLSHYCCRMNYDLKNYSFLNYIPEFSDFSG